MNLAQLRYFLAVLRTGGITAAARSLNVSQPAIGMRIRDLEAELGIRLLVRHSRGVTPTEAGEVLARHAEGLVAEADRIRRDIIKMGGGGEESVLASPVADLLETAQTLPPRDFADLAAGIVGLMAQRREGGGA